MERFATITASLHPLVATRRHSRAHHRGSGRPVRRPLQLGLLGVLVLASAGLLSLAGPTFEAAATGTPGQELMHVPLRWCAVMGSDAQANPGSVGEPSTNDYLWRRHERASDRVLIPGAMITGRSAFTAAYLAGDPTRGSFPIIADPNPPASGGPGVIGDILDPQIDPAEFNLAAQACNAAWDAMRVPGEPLVGLPAVNAHRLVLSNGTPAQITGYGAYTYTVGGGGSVDLCTNPPTITAPAFTWTGRFVVSDYSLTRGFDPDDLVVAHEFGHSVGLDHGNGLDDNNNGWFDLGCDNAESVSATPHSFMTSGAGLTRVVTGLQREKMRTVIRHLPGTQIDPPAALVNADTVSDQRTDDVLDVLAPEVDLATVAIAEIPSADAFVISHLTFGLIPREDVENQYLTFADLDNEPTTGGAPADLGFTTDFEGAELVTRVVVRPGYETGATAWVYRDGTFEEITDVTSEITTLTGTEDGVELANTVNVALPLSLRGPASIPFRFQAIAEQLQGDLEFDIMPNGSLTGGVSVALTPPIYPVCSVEPLQAQPGETVQIEIAGLLPNENVHVVLGDVLVATGSTDSNGDAVIDLTLPGDTGGGPRLVTVGVDGTALTADCYVDIPKRDDERGHAAVGTWRVQIPDAEAGRAEVYLTLHEDGTVTAVDAAAGIGLGAWNDTGAQTATLLIAFQAGGGGTDGPGQGLLTADGTMTVEDGATATLSSLSFVARTPAGDVREAWTGDATASRVAPAADANAAEATSP